MPHIDSILFLKDWQRLISVLVITIIGILGSSLLYGINAAPNVSDFPSHLLSLPNDVLLQKAGKYRSSEYPDSALLCYMIVAQREFDTSSPESIRQGLSARLDAGVLYYSPFYDYGKAYSLFQDTYALAKEQDNNEFMGLAANTIGNVLSVYNTVSYSEERTQEIIRWYECSVDELIKAGKASTAIPTIHNMLSMAMDTALLKTMTPSFMKYNALPLTDTIPGYGFTRKRIDAYLKVSEGEYGEATSLLRVLQNPPKV